MEIALIIILKSFSKVCTHIHRVMLTISRLVAIKKWLFLFLSFFLSLFFLFLESSSLKAASAHTVGGGREWPWEGVGRELQK